MHKRRSAVEKIVGRTGHWRVNEGCQRPFAEVFSENTFGVRAQKERLSEEMFNGLQNAIYRGEELSPVMADAVAQAMKEWAIKKGATHFCHWFQPLTDLTAEKHDALFSVSKEGEALADFGGKELVRGEPDASSFPSGGLRTTFEARGYTAWDPSSPAFLLGRTLVIPTMFLSWTGDALDKKTPLLRSMEVLDHHALRILRLFGDDTTHRVTSTVGAEQEYFLVDKYFYFLRPDLVACGRTLFGAQPPKGQELDDQYFGVIPERVMAFMEEVEYELTRLGIPVQTRHNEVAPGQYELALKFQIANLACDHHMVLMEMLRKVALRYDMFALLHEKPFEGINGSGKHTNWSLATDAGHNLLDPGETPHDNALFMIFCSAVLRAVHKYSALLRTSVASAGNDHRLGTHEAPPGILSVFLGEQLHNIFYKLVHGKERNHNLSNELLLGISMLPSIPRHLSDRNRTSPFAFTGNKFEFRAVGSNENISKAVTVLNTIVAESLDYFASELEKVSVEERQTALQSLLSQSAKEFEPIIFEGDNYNQAWPKEAQRRQLPNIANAVDALMGYTSPESIALFTKYKVFSRRELVARLEISMGKYLKKVTIEAKTLSRLVHTHILPASIMALKQMGEGLAFLSHSESDLLKPLSKEITGVHKSVKNLDDLLKKQPHETLIESASFSRDKILPAMATLRRHIDTLELLVDDALWPFPKYREMLFIR